MSELLDAYIEERALVAKAEIVKEIMHNLKINLEEALNISGIQGEEREQITKQIMG